MSNPTYSVFSSETRASDALTQLALDLHWTWNHSADEIWKRLDPELWELTGNPWLILQAISQRKLEELSDSGFQSRVNELLAAMKAKITASGTMCIRLCTAAMAPAPRGTAVPPAGASRRYWATRPYQLVDLGGVSSWGFFTTTRRGARSSGPRARRAMQAASMRW